MRGRTARLGPLNEAKRARSSSEPDPEGSDSRAAYVHSRIHDAPVTAAIHGGEQSVAAGQQLAPSRNGDDRTRFRCQRDRDATRQRLRHVAAVRETQLEPANATDAADLEPCEHEAATHDTGRTHRDANRKPQAHADAGTVERVGREHQGSMVVAGLRAAGHAYDEVDEPRSAGRHRQRARTDTEPGCGVPAGAGAPRKPRTAAEIDSESGAPHPHDETRRAEVREPHRPPLAPSDRETGGRGRK